MTGTDGIVHEQGVSCCGPASLSACLSILGLEAEPSELALVEGGTWDVCARALDQDQPRAIASRLGVSSEFLFRERDEGVELARLLREHLQRRGPALLLVSNFGRWVAVAGWLADEGSYVVLDPADGSQAFSRWTERKLLAEAWNVDGAGAEPSSFVAILVRRLDGELAKWRLTREFLDLCETISEDGAVGMVCDLEELIRRASPREEPVPANVRLSRVLETIEPAVFASIEYGERSPEVEPDQLRRRCRDYRIVAEAAGLQVSEELDTALLAEQIASLLSAYARTGVR